MPAWTVLTSTMLLLMLLTLSALTVSVASTPSSLGCFRDGSQNGNTRLFNHSVPNLQVSDATPAACAAACLKMYPESTLAGIEDSTQCFCGTYGAEVKGARGRDSECTMACSPASPLGSCGGNWWLSVYWIGAAPPPPKPPIAPPPPGPAGCPGGQSGIDCRKAVFECPASWPLCNTNLTLDER